MGAYKIGKFLSWVVVSRKRFRKMVINPYFPKTTPAKKSGGSVPEPP